MSAIAVHHDPNRPFSDQADRDAKEKARLMSLKQCRSFWRASPRVISAFSCILVLVLCSQLPAEPPSLAIELSDIGPPRAEDLLRQVIAEEKAILQATSFHARLVGRWTRTPAGIAQVRAQLVRQFGDKLRDEDFADLLPRVVETVEIAFDTKRFRLLKDKKDWVFGLRIWDGNQMIIHEHYLRDQRENYAYDSQPSQFAGVFLLADLSFGRVGSHKFLWQREGERVESQEHDPATGYINVGTVEVRQHPCWSLVNYAARRRIDISTRDGHLRRLVTYMLPTDNDPSVIFRKVAGAQADDNSFDGAAWLNGFSPEKRAELQPQIDEAIFQATVPLFENYCDDYREVAPGIWWPMQQGHSIYTSSGPSVVAVRRDQRTIEFAVNQPLDDNLFRIDFRDGVQVNDHRYDPVLTYTADSQRTEADFQELARGHPLQTRPALAP